MLNTILKPLQKIAVLLKKYAFIICFVIFGVMYGYLIYTSSRQTAQEPTEAEISAKFQGTKRPKVDDASAEALRELSDQNIEVKALFDEARNNPFSE